MSQDKTQHSQNVTGQNATQLKCHRTKCHQIKRHSDKMPQDKTSQDKTPRGQNVTGNNATQTKRHTDKISKNKTQHDSNHRKICHKGMVKMDKMMRTKCYRHRMSEDKAVGLIIQIRYLMMTPTIFRINLFNFLQVEIHHYYWRH